MPILTALVLMIQIAFAIHVVRSGREVFWIYIIVFVPLIGCAVYFFTQVLPELGNSRTVRRAGNSFANVVAPHRGLKQCREELAMSNTLDNRLRLADECLNANLVDEAIDIYTGSLYGAYENDPDILLKLAKAYFRAGDNEKTKVTLLRLIEVNPDYKSDDGHLLYARSLENLNLLADAEKEYEVLARSYPGEEARARYGMLLIKIGKKEKARVVFGDISVRVKRAPKYYKQKEKEWIRIAREA